MHYQFSHKYIIVFKIAFSSPNHIKSLIHPIFLPHMSTLRPSNHTSAIDSSEGRNKLESLGVLTSFKTSLDRIKPHLSPDLHQKISSWAQAEIDAITTSERGINWNGLVTIIGGNQDALMRITAFSSEFQDHIAALEAGTITPTPKAPMVAADVNPLMNSVSGTFDLKGLLQQKK